MSSTGPCEPAMMSKKKSQGNLFVVGACVAFVVTMVGAAYAAVPLYDLFCRITGYAGTPSISQASPVEVIDREVTVRFDANVSGGLPWRFEPKRRVVTAKAGEVVEVAYVIENESDAETWGTSTYNVAPYIIGGYFSKLQCFCFTAQRLGPGERREIPVVFYVDPAIAADDDADGVTSITLSYTFFPAEAPADAALARLGDSADTQGHPGAPNTASGGI